MNSRRHRHPPAPTRLDRPTVDSAAGRSPRRTRSRSSTPRLDARGPEQKDIFVMNADGSDVQQLTGRPRQATRAPSGRPTARKIAFSSDRDGQQEIYVMNADGTDPRAADRQPGARRVRRLAVAALRTPPGTRRAAMSLAPGRRVERP